MWAQHLRCWLYPARGSEAAENPPQEGVHGQTDRPRALAPTVTGFIVQATGSFVPALLASAAIGLVSALAYLVIIRGEPISAAELYVVAGGHAISPIP